MSNYTPLVGFEGMSEMEKKYCKVYKYLSPTGKILRQMELQVDGSYLDVTERAQREQEEKEQQELENRKKGQLLSRYRLKLF